MLCFTAFTCLANVYIFDSMYVRKRFHSVLHWLSIEFDDHSDPHLCLYANGCPKLVQYLLTNYLLLTLQWRGKAEYFPWTLHVIIFTLFCVNLSIAFWHICCIWVAFFIYSFQQNLFMCKGREKRRRCCCRCCTFSWFRCPNNVSLPNTKLYI